MLVAACWGLSAEAHAKSLAGRVNLCIQYTASIGATLRVKSPDLIMAMFAGNRKSDWRMKLV